MFCVQCNLLTEVIIITHRHQQKCEWRVKNRRGRGTHGRSWPLERRACSRTAGGGKGTSTDGRARTSKTPRKGSELVGHYERRPGISSAKPREKRQRTSLFFPFHPPCMRSPSSQAQAHAQARPRLLSPPLCTLGLGLPALTAVVATSACSRLAFVVVTFAVAGAFLFCVGSLFLRVIL